LVLKLCEVATKSPHFLGVSLVVGLVLQEVDALIGEGEGREEESFNRIAEVSVLCLLTIFVHDIPHNSEVNVGLSFLFRFLNEPISLVIPVGETDHHHAVNYLLFLVYTHLLEDIFS
jgi:hypothetical protein